MKKTFYLKNDKGKLLVEVIIFTFLDRVATVDVLTASNTGVKLSELELYILRDWNYRQVLRGGGQKPWPQSTDYPKMDYAAEL